MKIAVLRWMICAALLLALVGTAMAGNQGTAEPVAQLTVRGTALLEFPADQVRMSLGVEAVAETAQQALQQNAARLMTVEKALREAGLEEGEYQTGRFQIYPEWSPRPRQAPEDWRPAIVGYRASGSLMIRSRKIDAAGRFMEAAIGAGAGRIDSLLFDLADPRAYRAIAVEEATANARADARALAGASRVQLGRVLSIQLEETAAIPRPQEMLMRTADTVTAAPQLTPGTVPVTAVVVMTYQISGGEEEMGPGSGD
jgi:uncharacterized protein